MDKNKLLEIFSIQDIKYVIHDHSALHTVSESQRIRGEIDGAHTKNIFLKNKKSDFFLFSCLEETSIDLKKLLIN